jgi:hypothetical protein
MPSGCRAEVKHFDTAPMARQRAALPRGPSPMPYGRPGSTEPSEGLANLTRQEEICPPLVTETLAGPDR